MPVETKLTPIERPEPSEIGRLAQLFKAARLAPDGEEGQKHSLSHLTLP
jgi:hypothetical protein